MPRRLDLFPDLLAKDWWQATNYPRQLLCQKFALVLGDEDLSEHDVQKYKGFKTRPRMPASVKASGTSEVKIDSEWFQVTLVVDDFEKGELSVERKDVSIEVRGKHEEKRDQHGLVSREFYRQYMVPYDCDIEAISSYFSEDGKLIIKVPKVNKEQHIPDLVAIPLEDKSVPESIVVDKDLETLSSSEETDPATKNKIPEVVDDLKENNDLKETLISLASSKEETLVD